MTFRTGSLVEVSLWETNRYKCAEVFTTGNWLRSAKVALAYDTAAERIEMKHKKVATVAAGIIMALGGAAPAMADAGAEGVATDSPGVLTGNVIQVPVHVPLNACGNTLNVVALLNPAFGGVCSNA
ncbi:hypothetical protein QFZ67_002810 [Streptomyces sp. V1I1]|nr:hypothetical protein [Streptomyces sp. V1I1]